MTFPQNQKTGSVATMERCSNLKVSNFTVMKRDLFAKKEIGGDFSRALPPFSVFKDIRRSGLSMEGENHEW